MSTRWLHSSQVDFSAWLPSCLTWIIWKANYLIKSASAWRKHISQHQHKEGTSVEIDQHLHAEDKDLSQHLEHLHDVSWPWSWDGSHAKPLPSSVFSEPADCLWAHPWLSWIFSLTDALQNTRASTLLPFLTPIEVPYSKAEEGEKLQSEKDAKISEANIKGD